MGEAAVKQEEIQEGSEGAPAEAANDVPAPAYP